MVDLRVGERRFGLHFDQTYRTVLERPATQAWQTVSATPQASFAAFPRLLDPAPLLTAGSLTVSHTARPTLLLHRLRVPAG